MCACCCWVLPSTLSVHWLSKSFYTFFNRFIIENSMALICLRLKFCQAPWALYWVHISVLKLDFVFLDLLHLFWCIRRSRTGSSTPSSRRRTGTSTALGSSTSALWSSSVKRTLMRDCCPPLPNLKKHRKRWFLVLFSHFILYIHMRAHTICLYFFYFGYMIRLDLLL